jgi:hypothetical protein
MLLAIEILELQYLIVAKRSKIGNDEKQNYSPVEGLIFVHKTYNHI